MSFLLTLQIFAKTENPIDYEIGAIIEVCIDILWLIRSYRPPELASVPIKQRKQQVLREIENLTFDQTGVSFVLFSIDQLTEFVLGLSKYDDPSFPFHLSRGMGLEN